MVEENVQKGVCVLPFKSHMTQKYLDHIISIFSPSVADITPFKMFYSAVPVLGVRGRASSRWDRKTRLWSPVKPGKQRTHRSLLIRTGTAQAPSQVTRWSVTWGADSAFRLGPGGLGDAQASFAGWKGASSWRVRKREYRQREQQLQNLWSWDKVDSFHGHNEGHVSDVK